MPLVCCCAIACTALVATAGLAVVLGARIVWEILRTDCCCVRKTCRAADAERRDKARSEVIIDELTMFVEAGVISYFVVVPGVCYVSYVEDDMCTGGIDQRGCM